MRATDVSGGRILLGLLGLLMGALMVLVFLAEGAGGFDLEVVAIGLFTLVLLLGGTHEVFVGFRGGRLPGDPQWERSRQWWDPRSGWRRVAVIAVVASPFALFFSASTACGCNREYIAAMRSDLRSFRLAQETYFGDGHYTYSGDPVTLGLTGSEGVTLEVLEAGSRGWAARATHASLGNDVGCVLAAGDVEHPPTTPGGSVWAEEFDPVCDPVPR